MHKATDEAYDNLPSCCHNNRARADMKTRGKTDMKMDMSPKK